MRTYLPFAVYIALCSATHAQVHQIPRTEFIKSGQKLEYLRTEELKWGAVESECLEKPVVSGKWVEIRSRSAEATVRIEGAPRNGVENPVLYLGEIVDDGRSLRIREVACFDYSDSEEESYWLSISGLDKKKQYFLLVAAHRAGLVFNVTLEEGAAPMPETITPEPETTGVSIAGRITNRKTGRGVKDQRIELLDSEMRLLRHAVTNSKGDFRFEKLPKEEVYLTRIEEEDPELEVEMYLFDTAGQPVRGASKVGERLYGFPMQENSFVQLVLLSELDWQLDVERGMVGITGRIVDAATLLQGFDEIEVGLYDQSRRRLEKALTDEEGRFIFMNREKGTYLVKYENKPSDSYSEVVVVDDKNVPFLYATSRMEEDGFFRFEELPRELVEMKRMEVADTELKVDIDFSQMDNGEPIVLKNILFSTGSYELLPTSYGELNALAEALKARPDLDIEISGHTDNTGNANANLLLSENRAKSVMQHLVSKGIPASRLTARGYGSQKPVASNASEEGRRQNRRVEFVVLK